MKLRAVLCVGLVLIGACCAPPHPDNVYVTESGIEYKIRVEIVFPPLYETRYPFITRAFQDALNEWASHIPIDPVIIPLDYWGRQNVFTVEIGPEFMPMGGQRYYGLWYRENRRLYLNSTLLTTYDDAYDVALHELGHAFGLAHVINISENGITGSIVVPNDPSYYLMYDTLVDTNRGAGIGPLEIEIAREYIKTRLWQ